MSNTEFEVEFVKRVSVNDVSNDIESTWQAKIKVHAIDKNARITA